MPVPTENATAETIILFSCVFTFLLFLLSLAFYLNTTYNFNPDGTIIKDSEYNTAQIWKTVAYVSAVIFVIAFIIFRLY